MASPAPSTGSKDIEQLAVDTVRMLSIDAVEKANSGHPGAPLGCADMAYVLWAKFLRFNPEDPQWIERDRFVLSNGHASMLQYSLLHLFGYPLPLDELKNFRQLGSKTPGHPEYGLTPGIEVTTGPLGQGFAHGVGMALAARLEQARFPGDGDFCPATRRVWGIVSDGDLMEGVASEAASLAGHLKLDNLVYLYDDNHITIDGRTDLAFTEDVQKRFEAYGWHTLKVDGHDRAQIEEALTDARDHEGQPTLILARTIIGRGAPHKQDTSGVHGSPLGADELAATKKAYDWPLEPTFYIPDEVREHYAGLVEEKKAAYGKWTQAYEQWKKRDTEQANAHQAFRARELPDDFDEQILEATPRKDNATRKHSGAALQKVAELLPGLIGGSADLAGSNNSQVKDGGDIEAGAFDQRNLFFGVREHAMAAIANGMTLDGAVRGYGATFLIFSDYCRPSLRLAALMNVASVFIFTHDSIFLGEDGPTHQSIEQLSSLRAIPRMNVWRPADSVETAMTWAWVAANEDQGPSSLALTRQGLPELSRPSGFTPRDVWKGGYVVREADGKPDAVIIATGSEVHVAVGAAEKLASQGKNIRVVSMPSCEAFERQDESYKKSVLPDGVPVAAVEAGVPMTWYRYTGTDGLIVGMTTFGESAPWKDLAEHFGFTADQVAEAVSNWLA